MAKKFNKEGAFARSIREKLADPDETSMPAAISENADSDEGQEGRQTPQTSSSENNMPNMPESDNMLQSNNMLNMINMSEIGKSNEAQPIQPLISDKKEPTGVISGALEENNRLQENKQGESDNMYNMSNMPQSANMTNMTSQKIVGGNGPSTGSDKKGRVTFDAGVYYAEMLERAAFWERRTIKMLMGELLQNYFKDKQYDPIPDELKPGKRGRPSKE